MVQVRKPRQQRKSNAGLPGQPVLAPPETVSAPADALDPSLLTPSVWQELVRTILTRAIIHSSQQLTIDAV